MKVLKNRTGQRGMATIKASLIFMVITFAFSACTDNLVFIRYTVIPPPPPDTLQAIASNALSAASGAIDQHIRLAGDEPVWPPVPDTLNVSVGKCHKIKNIDIHYNVYSTEIQKRRAYISGPNNEIIDSVNIISGDKPLSSAYGDYYTARATFQLGKSAKFPFVKVVIPNEALFPDGKEIFYIQFE
jgi:hypothetical protein